MDSSITTTVSTKKNNQYIFSDEPVKVLVVMTHHEQSTVYSLFRWSVERRPKDQSDNFAAHSSDAWGDYWGGV